MTNVTTAGNQNQENQTPPAATRRLSPTIKALWHAIGIAFWAYLIVKLFIFDFDVYLFENYWPQAKWVLDYKLLVYLGLAAILLVAFGTEQFLLLTLFTVTYPAIIIFWKLPKFIFKQQSWNLALAVLTTVVSFFQSLKYNILVSALCLTSLAISISSSNAILLQMASAVLLILLTLTYLRSFIAVFRPKKLFRLYTKIFSVVRERVTSSSTVDNALRDLPVSALNEVQLKKWTEDLGAVVLINRACLFSARRLMDYQKSGLSVVFGVLTALTLVVATTLSFSAINFALFKVDPSLFETTNPSFFSFFYYSFNNLLFNSIKEVSPVKALAQSLSMLENFFALFLIAMFVSLLITVRSERYAAEIDQVVKTVEEDGRQIELFIKKEYRLDTIDQAIAELERLQAGIIKLLLWFTRNLR